MKIEKINYDETLIQGRGYPGQWLDLLTNLPSNQMLRISDSKNLKAQQCSILGCLRYYRRLKKSLPFKVHTARRGKILYVWKEIING